MPTIRPRYQVTETPEVARALDRAAKRWPGEPRTRLLVRLVEVGGGLLESEESACELSHPGRGAGHRWSIRRGMRDDLFDAGVRVAPHDDDEPLRLAELRVSTGLKLPDCCVLDVALRHRAALATFDNALSVEAAKRGVPVG